ncbi:MAG: hypothetical protein WCF44_20470 [Candidatus Methylophosphatis roskildensis]
MRQEDPHYDFVAVRMSAEHGKRVMVARIPDPDHIVTELNFSHNCCSPIDRLDRTGVCLRCYRIEAFSFESYGIGIAVPASLSDLACAVRTIGLRDAASAVWPDRDSAVKVWAPLDFPRCRITTGFACNLMHQEARQIIAAAGAAIEGPGSIPKVLVMAPFYALCGANPCLLQRETFAA